MADVGAKAAPVTKRPSSKKTVYAPKNQQIKLSQQKIHRDACIVSGGVVFNLAKEMVRVAMWLRRTAESTFQSLPRLKAFENWPAFAHECGKLSVSKFSGTSTTKDYRKLASTIVSLLRSSNKTARDNAFNDAADTYRDPDPKAELQGGEAFVAHVDAIAKAVQSTCEMRSTTKEVDPLYLVELNYFLKQVVQKKKQAELTKDILLAIVIAEAAMPQIIQVSATSNLPFLAHEARSLLLYFFAGAAGIEVKKAAKLRAVGSPLEANPYESTSPVAFDSFAHEMETVTSVATNDPLLSLVRMNPWMLSKPLDEYLCRADAAGAGAHYSLPLHIVAPLRKKSAILAMPVEGKDTQALKRRQDDEDEARKRQATTTITISDADTDNQVSALESLPAEILMLVLSGLPLFKLVRAIRVNRMIAEYASDPALVTRAAKRATSVEIDAVLGMFAVQGLTHPQSTIVIVAHEYALRLALTATTDVFAPFPVHGACMLVECVEQLRAQIPTAPVHPVIAITIHLHETLVPQFFNVFANNYTAESFKWTTSGERRNNLFVSILAELARAELLKHCGFARQKFYALSGFMKTVITAPPAFITPDLHAEFVRNFSSLFVAAFWAIGNASNMQEAIARTGILALVATARGTTPLVRSAKILAGAISLWIDDIVKHGDNNNAAGDINNTETTPQAFATLVTLALSFYRTRNSAIKARNDLLYNAVVANSNADIMDIVLSVQTPESMLNMDDIAEMLDPDEVDDMSDALRQLLDTDLMKAQLAASGPVSLNTYMHSIANEFETNRFTYETQYDDDLGNSDESDDDAYSDGNRDYAVANLYLYNFSENWSALLSNPLLAAAARGISLDFSDL